MNWYKEAIKYPKPKNNLSWRDMWFSPDGVLYSIFPFIIHDDWVDNFEDFLMGKYNIEQPVDMHILDADWIRFRGGTTINIEVSVFSRKIIKNLENILFQNQKDILLDNKIQLESTKGEVVTFTWGEFIQSGSSLFDFVSEKKSNR